MHLSLNDLVERTLLLSFGATINCRNVKLLTPLHYAVMGGHSLIIRELIQQRANLDACDLFGSTASHIAAKQGDLESLKFLLESGADVNAKDNEGYLPLHVAVWADHVEVVQLLLETSANTNWMTLNHGFTPLHIAATSMQKNSPLIVELLIQFGGLADQPTINGETALQLAKRRGQMSTIEAFMKFKNTSLPAASISADSDPSNSPSHQSNHCTNQ